MVALILLEKTTPDLISLFLPLLGILLLVFALNTLYEWLKTKPWKKSEIPTPPDEISEQQLNQIPSGDEEINSDHKDLFGDSLQLSNSI